MRLIDRLGDDPLAALAVWIADAAQDGAKEPTAMALATATPDGAPSVRIVLAKEIERGAVRFFTNYDSRKAGELTANPRAAASFHWVDLARQVRLEGPVSRLTRRQSEDYFATRPRDSQLAAWASPQSRPLASYTALLDELAAVTRRFADVAAVPCPPNWGGFALAPHTVEFWVGLPSRLHDRVVYERTGSAWTKRQVAP